MVDASPSPRSRCSTPRAKTKSEGHSTSPGMNLLSALRDQGISAELLGAKASSSSAIAAQDGQQSVDDQQSGQQAMQLPQDAPTPSADAAPDQPLDDSSGAEDLMDPDVALALALECVKDWHTGTSKELAAMPQRRPDDPFNHGMWRWLSGLFGSTPAGVPRPFSTQEQGALVLGHAQLSQRMLHLQTLLFILQTSVGKHAKKLQLMRGQLEAAAAGNTCLRLDCNRHTKEKNAKLLLTIDDYGAVHAQAEELQAEVLKLEQKVAAGNMLVNTMTSEKESLESFMEKATTCRLLEFETLRTCCKALEAQNARYMVEDMETERATYQTLRSTQDQQLQDAAPQLAAAHQQGRDAVTAAEARAAAERQPLENAVLQLQSELNATQLDLDRVTAQLDTTGAKFGDLVKKLARAGKEKEKAAAGLAAATTTNATLQKDKLQLEATIQALQEEKVDITQRLAKALEELEEVNQRLASLAPANSPTAQVQAALAAGAICAASSSTAAASVSFRRVKRAGMPAPKPLPRNVRFTEQNPHMHGMARYLAGLWASGRDGWNGHMAPFLVRCITPDLIAPFNASKPNDTLMKIHKQRVLEVHLMTARVVTVFKDVPEPVFAGEHMLQLDHPATVEGVALTAWPMLEAAAGGPGAGSSEVAHWPPAHPFSSPFPGFKEFWEGCPDLQDLPGLVLRLAFFNEGQVWHKRQKQQGAGSQLAFGPTKSKLWPFLQLERVVSGEEGRRGGWQLVVDAALLREVVWSWSAYAAADLRKMEDSKRSREAAAASQGG